MGLLLGSDPGVLKCVSTTFRHAAGGDLLGLAGPHEKNRPGARGPRAIVFRTFRSLLLRLFHSCWRRMRRRSLPPRVRGMASMNSISRGSLYTANLPLAMLHELLLELLGRRHAGLQLHERLVFLPDDRVGGPRPRGVGDDGCITSASSISSGPIR